MDFIIYEQPLNEQLRLCLRLEYLFEQTKYYLLEGALWNSHQLLRIILEIIQTIDRSDLKSKFSQTLSQYAYSLSQLEKVAGVDKPMLLYTLKQIDNLVNSLHNNPKKIGVELKENGFLHAIQQRLSVPAGTCDFSLPAYHLWLHQESSLRKHQLMEWLKHFAQLQETVNMILKLARESTLFSTVDARGGFYNSVLDPHASYQLIRIKLHLSKNIFPETSVGRYRLAIHFFTLDMSGRTAQVSDDIDFELACCKM